MSECQSRLSLSARVYNTIIDITVRLYIYDTIEREPEGYTLAVSHGRHGISQQASGVALPYTEKSECGDQMSESVSTTHKLFA